MNSLARALVLILPFLAAPLFAETVKDREGAVVEVDGDDVRKREFFDGGLSVIRAVEDERDQWQRFPETEWNTRLHQFPFFLLLAALIA
jgi:hypothetical protein